MEYLSIILSLLILFLLTFIAFLLFAQKQGAKNAVEPIQNQLKELDQQLKLFERYRLSDAIKIEEEFKKIHQTDAIILKETKLLFQALKKPDVRGFWGEIQLKKILESAGMLAYVDFLEQPVIGAQESRLRPDVIVRLPQKKQIIIDAKTPMESYIEAHQAEDSGIFKEKMLQHAKRIKDHIDSLKKKGYAKDSFSFEYVLLFLPLESLFSSALEADPSLLEYAYRQDVLIVTPSSLIAFLKTVATAWKEDLLRENLEQVKTLGAELHKRLVDATGHIHSMSKALNQAVDAHNKFIGSFERRVMVSARKFEELAVGTTDQPLKQLEELGAIAKECTKD
jgi:DNA recombination protein RmuC